MKKIMNDEWFKDRVLIFAAIEAGLYYVLFAGIKVAVIKRKKYPHPTNSKWTRVKYVFKSNDGWKREFATLADIHDAYKFKNYAGYGKVLRRQENHGNHWR